MEHIFLHHKVDDKIMDRLNTELNDLANELEEIHKDSENSQGSLMNIEF